MSLQSEQKVFIDQEQEYIKDSAEEVDEEFNELDAAINTLVINYLLNYNEKDSVKVKRRKLNALKKAVKLSTGKVADKSADIIQKYGFASYNNGYLGNGYSYSKISERFLKYNKPSKNKLKVTMFDKIRGKTYVDRLNFHSKNLDKKVASIIVSGVRNNLDEKVIAKQIKKRIDVTESRALTISRTEIGRMGSVARQESSVAAIKQGMVFNKTWKHFYSPGEREDHIRMDGVTVKDGELFKLPSGYTCEYPRLTGNPGDDINCKCQAREYFVEYKGKLKKTKIPSYKTWVNKL